MVMMEESDTWVTYLTFVLLTYCYCTVDHDGGDGAREPSLSSGARAAIVKLEDSQPEITLDFLQHKDLI